MNAMRPRGWLINGALLALAITFMACFWIFQDDIARFLINPRQPFQTASPPPPPDYGLQEAWAILPLSISQGRPAVFIVHSTTFYERAGWNAPIEGSTGDVDLERAALPNEAGPFMSWADVYAPRYRQATLFARFTLKYEGLAAHERAYSDVRTAFLAFVDRLPADQPIILAGYGQGGLHVLGLVAEFLRGSDAALVDRIAVIYVIGQATPVDFLAKFQSVISICEAPEAVRCLAAYTPLEDGAVGEMERVRRYSLAWEEPGKLMPLGERPLLCVNPLDWRVHEDYVGPEMHVGAASATGIELGRPIPVVSGAIGAACERGILKVDRPMQRYLRTSGMFGAKWKAQPFNLFFHDLTADAQTRVQNLQMVWQIESQRIEPIEETVEIVDSPIRQVPSEN